MDSLDGCAAPAAAAPAPPGIDRATIDAAYRDLADRLRRLAYRILGDCHEAEDIAQEVVLAAFRNAPTLRDPARLEGWLVRIARNVASTAARKARRCRPDIRLTGVDPDEFEGPPLPRSALLSPEPSAEAVTCLRDAWHAAPPAWRDAFRAHVLLGRSVDSVAAEHGVSVACVRTRISRVRKRLREAI